MRTALTQIKEELGADAVIMSNKKIPEGVELMAAVDYGHKPETTEPEATQPKAELADDVVKLSVGNQSQVAQIPNQREMQADTEQAAPADSLAALLSRNVQQEQSTNIQQQSTSQEPDLEVQLKKFTDRLQQQGSEHSNEQQETDIDNIYQGDGFGATKVQNQAVNSQTQATSADVVSVDAFNQMKEEMASIRQLLEHQVSGLMWQDMAQKDPNRAMLNEKLISLGISEGLADQIAGYVPSHLSQEQSWESALQLLTNQINTTNNDIIHRGGVVSLVGPTGVGKTTTLAKLAARFAQVHGADELVLISTDTYRIGGFEQLETYGKIIGCQVKLAKDQETLEMLLQQFSNKKLVLIDTAGMGQRDMRLAEHLSGLVANSRTRIRNYLVLAANTQQAVMQENVERFKKIPLCGCIFTKLDESLSMGEIIATAIQNGLPIGYLTDGQRVPEDIKVANAEKLVSLAEKIANKSAMKFNFVAHKQQMASAAVG